jgi:hypothetical protein
LTQNEKPPVVKARGAAHLKISKKGIPELRNAFFERAAAFFPSPDV